MEIFRIALLLMSFFAQLIEAWQPLHAVLQYFRSSSRIPQFLHDAQHPWLIENKAWIEQLNNPELALCSLDSDLRPGNQTSLPGTIQYPATFFHTLEVNNNRYGIDRGGWSNAHARLGEILRCPAALHDVRSFQVNIYVSDGRYDYGVKESPDPPSDLPHMFFHVLSMMNNLERLDWTTHGNGNQQFRQVFCENGMNLPSVRHLKLPDYMSCLVAICPNLEVLECESSLMGMPWKWTSEGDPALDLIQSAGLAENLTRFRLDGRWELVHLEAALEAIPGIRSFEIGGSLAPRHIHNSSLLDAYIQILNQFSSLKHLSLPDAWELGLDFDGGPGCGNAYFGRYGQAMRRLVAGQGAETTDKAAKMVLARIPDLEALSIGSACTNVTGRHTGQPVAIYSWTNRIKEWTYEMWPGVEFPDGDNYYWDDLDDLSEMND